MPAKRLTRAEIEANLSEAQAEVSALRVYTSAIRAGETPALVLSDVIPHDDYREQWTLYRPTAAAGGVIVIEQFNRTVDLEGSIAWNVTLACLLRVDPSDFYRQEARSQVMRAQGKACRAEGQFSAL